MSKEQKRGIFLSAFLIICTYMLYLARINETYSISMLFNKLSSGMQIRQIAASYFLFLIGYWELMCARVQWMAWKKIAIAYILGIALWGILSVLYLCIGVSYNLGSMIIGFIVIGGVSFVLGRKDIREELKAFACDSFIFIGIACWASTGIMNITFGTGDSQYLIQQWGRDIAILGCLDIAQGTFLTSTGLLPATFSSLTYFFRCDNIYTIHNCFEICFWIFFGSAVEESIPDNQQRFCPKRIISICLTLFVYMLPPIRFLSGWIISNMYLMAYMFVICYYLKEMLEEKEVAFRNIIFIMAFVIALFFLRVDSPITICIILGCYAICYTSEAKKLLPFLLAALVFFVGYYLKIFILLQGQMNGLFISMSTLLLMGMAFAVVGGFILAAKYITRIIADKYIYKLLYGALFVFNIILFIIYKNIYVDNLYVIFKNMVVVDWYWGGTLSILVVSLLYAIYKRGNYDAFLTIGICTIMIYIDLGVLRTINGAGAARLGFGDSMNRSIISVLPMIFYDFLQKLLINFKIDFAIKNHSS